MIKCDTNERHYATASAAAAAARIKGQFYMKIVFLSTHIFMEVYIENIKTCPIKTFKANIYLHFNRTRSRFDTRIERMRSLGHFVVTSRLKFTAELFHLFPPLRESQICRDFICDENSFVYRNDFRIYVQLEFPRLRTEMN